MLANDSWLRSLITISLVLALVFSVAACGGQEEPGPEGQTGETETPPEPEGPAVGGDLIIGRASEGDTLDPHRTLAGASHAVFSQILDTLVIVDTDLTFKPGLAKEWEISEDGLVYTFFLREDVKFHDGTPFNADAVKFTFDRIMDETEVAPAKDQLGPIVSVDVVDEYTIRFTHSEPFAPFMYNLSVAYLGIISPAAVEEWGEDFGQHPVGTGPFVFEEWIPGDHITLVRNPDYVQLYPYAENPGAPYVERLIFKTIQEEQTLVAALETGEINLVTPPASEVQRLQDSPEFEVLFTEGGTSFYYLEFTWKNWPFDDIKVRKAAAYALNRSDFVTAAWEGMCTEIKTPLPPGIMGFSEEAGEEFGYEHDLQKAKDLLAEAGWVDTNGDGIVEKDGEDFSIVHYTWEDPRLQKAAQLLQNQLGKIGIDVKIESMEIGTLFAKQPEQKYQSLIMGWGWAEPTLLTMMFADWRNMGIYDVDVDNPPLAELLHKADTTPQIEKRLSYIEQAQEIMLKDALTIPICSPKSYVAFPSTVQGFKFGPYGRWFYGDAWIKTE